MGFSIYPSTLGYLNEPIQIISYDQNNHITIAREGLEVTTVSFDRNMIASINLDVPGDYTFYETKNKECTSRNLQIADSIRFGNSVMDKAFVFEDIPIVFFVSKITYCCT